MKESKMNKKLTITEMGRMSVEEFHKAKKIPLIAVLDNVRSRHNVGAVFRTSDAFRLESVYLCGISSCPPSEEIHKTALGAEESVDWKYFEQTMDAVRALHEQGYVVFAIEQAHNSIRLENVPAIMEKAQTNKMAVIFGHEVFGVQQEVVDACDGCIEIPQYGTKHSLNVSVTAGIVLYELSNLYH